MDAPSLIKHVVKCWPVSVFWITTSLLVGVVWQAVIEGWI